MPCLVPLQASHFRRGIENRADLARKRSRLLRGRGNIRQRRLEPGRAKLDQVEPKIAEREPRAVELAREHGAMLDEVLERAALPPQQRKSPLELGRIALL